MTTKAIRDVQNLATSAADFCVSHAALLKTGPVAKKAAEYFKNQQPSVRFMAYPDWKLLAAHVEGIIQEAYKLEVKLQNMMTWLASAHPDAVETLRMAEHSANLIRTFGTDLEIQAGDDLADVVATLEA